MRTKVARAAAPVDSLCANRTRGREKSPIRKTALIHRNVRPQIEAARGGRYVCDCMNLASTSIRAFVPGGRDYALSKRFYEALGFTLTFDAGEVAGFRHGACEFLLQNFYNEDWAGNFMMQLLVD